MKILEYILIVAVSAVTGRTFYKVFAEGGGEFDAMWGSVGLFLIAFYLVNYLKDKG